jgi:hypothetical protein
LRRKLCNVDLLISVDNQVLFGPPTPNIIGAARRGGLSNINAWQFAPVGLLFNQLGEASLWRSTRANDQHSLQARRSIATLAELHQFAGFLLVEI